MNHSLAAEDDGSALEVDDSLGQRCCLNLSSAKYSALEASITMRSISFSVSSRSEYKRPSARSAYQEEQISHISGVMMNIPFFTGAKLLLTLSIC